VGEYTRNGDKMGTCEDMYYLRFQDRGRVTPESGSLDPANPKIVPVLRWRFPWPDEDHIQPCGGEYHDNGYSRAIAVPGYNSTSEDVEHGTVQFSAQAGYLVSLPCPESPTYNGPHIHRNGFRGSVLLRAQKYVEGVGLVPVLECGGCARMWRCEDVEDIERMAVAFRSEGDRRERRGAHNGTGEADRVWWDAVADRLLAGIAQPA